MSELGETHQDKVTVEHYDATIEPHKNKQQGYGFQSHGLLIQNKTGDIVFKQADHAVNENEVKAFVETYLKKD